MVSVIIRDDNAAKFLQDAIASVKQQTFVYGKLLMMNDESTDDAVRIIGEYQTVDDHLHLLSKIHQGVSTIPNPGVEKGHSQTLAFLNADNQCLPNQLYQNLTHFQFYPRLRVSFAQVERLNRADGVSEHVASSRLTNLTPEYFLLTNHKTTNFHGVVCG